MPISIVMTKAGLFRDTATSRSTENLSCWQGGMAGCQDGFGASEALTCLGLPCSSLAIFDRAEPGEPGDPDPPPWWLTRPPGGPLFGSPFLVTSEPPRDHPIQPISKHIER